MLRHKLILLWLIAVVLAVVHVLAFASESARIGALDLVNLFITAGVLPFAAGFICARNGKPSSIAMAAAGLGIAVATLVGVGVAYLVTASGWLAFAGFVLATGMFTVVPSILLAVIGGWVARKYEPTRI